MPKSESTRDSSVPLYYKNVISTYKTISDEEEKENLLTQAFSSLEKECLTACTHVAISYNVENLLTFKEINANHISKLLKGFSKDWKAVITNKKAHHVLESAMMKAQDFLDDSELFGLCNNLCAHISESYPEYLQDPSASYILRAYLLLLTGVKVTKTKKNDVATKNDISLTTPLLTDCSSQINLFIKKFLYSTTIKDLIADSLVSGFLQTLLIVSSSRLDKDQFKEHCTALLNETILKPTVPVTFQSKEKLLPLCLSNKSSTFFLEQLVVLMPQTVLVEQFLPKYMKDCELYWAMHETGNFILKRIIEVLKKKDLLIQLLDILKDHFAEFIQYKRHNLLLAFSSTCLRMNTLQNTFKKAILFALNCDKLSENGNKPSALILSSYLNMLPSDQITDGHPICSMNGVLLVKNLLQFDQPNLLAGSLLAWSDQQVIQLCIHDAGSRMVEDYLSSETVSDDHKTNLIEKILSSVMEVACNKNGSHVMDAIWETSSLDTLELVTKTLTLHDSKLSTHFFGRFVYRKFLPDVYKKNPAAWMKSIKSADRDTKSASQKRLAGNQHVEEPKMKKKKKKKAQSSS